jgi:hypothetical protein
MPTPTPLARLRDFLCRGERILVCDGLNIRDADGNVVHLSRYEAYAQWRLRYENLHQLCSEAEQDLRRLFPGESERVYFPQRVLRFVGKRFDAIVAACGPGEPREVPREVSDTLVQLRDAAIYVCQCADTVESTISAPTSSPTPAPVLALPSVASPTLQTIHSAGAESISARIPTASLTASVPPPHPLFQWIEQHIRPDAEVQRAFLLAIAQGNGFASRAELQTACGWNSETIVERIRRTSGDLRSRLRKAGWQIEATSNGCNVRMIGT